MKKTFKYYLQFFILFIGLFLSCNTVFANINDNFYAFAPYGGNGSDSRINNMEVTVDSESLYAPLGFFRYFCIQRQILFIFDTNHNLLKKITCEAGSSGRERVWVDTPIIILGTGWNFPYIDYISDSFQDIKQSAFYGGEVKVRALPFIHIYGCIDVLAKNYNPQATDDNLTCLYNSKGIIFPINHSGSSDANLLSASIINATGKTTKDLIPILAVVGGIIFGFIVIVSVINLIKETDEKHKKPKK